ncbi:hypothetical protein KR026_010763, partial [Drosophila bipectinata]
LNGPKMDDNSSGRTSLADSASLTNSSLRSGASSSQSLHSTDSVVRVAIPKMSKYREFPVGLQCEKIIIQICRELGIKPTCILLFGIREHHTTTRSPTAVRIECTWVSHNEHLKPEILYCFKMRFRVPELDTQLEQIDQASHSFLYRQMSYDMVNELIPEIRYPDHKNMTSGLIVVDMIIDMQLNHKSMREMEKMFKKYLPPRLWKAHSIFVGSKILEVFRTLSANSPSVDRLMWHYVHQVAHLAPTYLTEQFMATVMYLPNEDLPGGAPYLGHGLTTIPGALTSTSSSDMGSTSTISTLTTNVGSGKKGKRRPPNAGIDVYVRVFPHDSPNPGLKVARVTSEATLKWLLVGRVEGIFMISKISNTDVRLEIEGLPKGFEMRFQTEQEMKSFISYLSIYIRLTTKWMQDLCHSYRTPSLEELGTMHIHPPIGGAYSLMKLHENGDRCGSYIVRQCDREYGVYYIDINTKIIARETDQERCKPETFRIVRLEANQWRLTYNNVDHTFNSLAEVAHFIKADTNDRVRLPPSKYDKPPLLLLLLPKNLKAKKTDLQLSESELQRRNPQIFNPKTDLQWYPDLISLCEDGMMFSIRGDWIQQSPVKDVPVTMKMLKSDGDFMEFFRLAQTWSLIQSPQFLKLYGLTLSDPYTMVMEYNGDKPLNRFLQTKRDVSLHCLLDLMHGLVRGMHYLEDNKIIHSYIRASNMYVTKYDPSNFILEAKISDPGYPRPYGESDSPWIPVSYYRNLQAAKNDIHVQFWAFATTTYEIFSRCQRDLRTLRQEDLRRQRNMDGNILEPLDADICPSLISETIMDGWSDEFQKRFSPHLIFARLSIIKDQYATDYMPAPGFDTNGTTDEYRSESHNIPCPIPFPKSNLCMVVELNDCRLIFSTANQIGQGHYGVVYRGQLEYYDKDRSPEQVAIKQLTNNMHVSADFLREIDIMRELDHPNVVKFKYYAERRQCIVMEYLSGSFDQYLRFEAPNLKNSRLISFALEIALGMDYLAGKHLIHRDLAARNILVDRNGGCDSVKISDFGLAQFANSDGYYIAISNRDIPIKWYAPEAISTGKISTYSDVWSYGVTLYEMFSRGELPNLHPIQKDNEDFLKRLIDGERLPCPKDCPEFIYALMKECWNATPRSRPRFSDIVRMIAPHCGIRDSLPTSNGAAPRPDTPPTEE